MSHARLDLIPDSHRATAQAALAATFGAADLKALTPVAGGASGALTYRAEIGGRAYLLRLETARDGLRDPHRSYPCMRAAADAGIAPPLHHADPTAGVAIMDFLPERPLTEHPGGAEGVARELGGLLARLQATPAFPALLTYPAMLERMLAMVGGLFAEGLLTPHIAAFETIRAAYPWDAAMVSSHNDPNPRNLLFDGQRLWLIDWEIAFRNDPMADVAIVANEFATTPELETVLLSAWLGRAPDRAVHARLTLMRRLVSLYYGCLIFSTLIGRIRPETDLRAPAPDAFRQDVAEGRIVLGSPECMRILGKMHLARLAADLDDPAFKAALRDARQG
jgi:aminoglycoside phosphotransferase (APT) family kinase protein